MPVTLTGCSWIMSRRKQKRPQQLVNADPGGTRLMPQGEEIIPLLIICYFGLTDSDALLLFFKRLVN